GAAADDVAGAGVGGEGEAGQPGAAPGGLDAGGEVGQRRDGIGEPAAPSAARRQVGDQLVQLAAAARLQGLVDAAQERLVRDMALDGAVAELVDRAIAVPVGRANRRMRRAHVLEYRSPETRVSRLRGSPAIPLRGHTEYAYLVCMSIRHGLLALLARGPRHGY